jgi:hypothetical protein
MFDCIAHFGANSIGSKFKPVQSALWMEVHPTWYTSNLIIHSTMGKNEAYKDFSEFELCAHQIFG